MSKTTVSDFLGMSSIRFKFWLNGGYVILYNVDREYFDGAATEVISRMQQGQDIPVGEREEHDATLWSIGEHGEVLLSHLPDYFSIPNNKVITYALG